MKSFVSIAFKIFFSDLLGLLSLFNNKDQFFYIKLMLLSNT